MLKNFSFQNCPQCGYKYCGLQGESTKNDISVFCFSCGFFSRIEVIHEMKITKGKTLYSLYNTKGTGGVRLEAFSYKGNGVYIMHAPDGIFIDRIPSAFPYTKMKKVLELLNKSHRCDECCLTLWNDQTRKVELIGGDLFENWGEQRDFKVTSEWDTPWLLTEEKLRECKLTGLGNFLEDFYGRLEFSRKSLNSEKAPFEFLDYSNFASLNFVLQDEQLLFNLLKDYLNGFREHSPDEIPF